MQGSGGIDMIMGTSSNLAYQIDIQIKTYKDLLVLENEPESLTAQTEEKSEQAKDWERIANLFENARLQNNRVLGYLATEESVKHFLKFDKKTNQEKIDYLDSFIAPVKDFAENPNRHDKKLGVHGIALESIQAASFLNFLQKQRKEYENSEPEKDERTKKSMQDSLKVKDREDKERTAARLVMLLKYLIVKSEITDSNPTSIGEFISFLTGKSADNLRKLYKNPLNKEKAGNYNADLDFVIKKLQLLGIAETRDGLSKFFSENEN
jgi:hypothetical protein